jgi:hypothetical protein
MTRPCFITWCCWNQPIAPDRKLLILKHDAVLATQMIGPGAWSLDAWPSAESMSNRRSFRLCLKRRNLNSVHQGHLLCSYFGFRENPTGSKIVTMPSSCHVRRPSMKRPEA